MEKDKEYYEFKKVGHGSEVIVRVDHVDLTYYELHDHFTDFCKGCSFHHDTVEDGVLGEEHILDKKEDTEEDTLRHVTYFSKDYLNRYS